MNRDESKEKEINDEWDSFGSNISYNERELDGSWDFSIKRSFQVDSEYYQKAPQWQMDKLKKVNTLRLQKIQHIMSDYYKIQGVKFVDLHLLNMTK